LLAVTRNLAHGKRQHIARILFVRIVRIFAAKDRDDSKRRDEEDQAYQDA
jgi:hypothetical protein